MQNVDFNNPANYKNCSKKLYEIHVCMPPKNTVVINSLEQADVVKMLNGKTYFTVDELEHMQKNGDGRFNIISQAVNSGRAYLVSDKTPFVLCGTNGELWTISPDKLAQTYTFLQNNQPYPINQQSLSRRVRKDGILDWTAVRVSQQAIRGQNMACFVPSSQKGQIQTSWGAVLNLNGVGVSHGKGDFVVCAKLPNGQPNLADRWVVNGEIFAATYNNQGWNDCLKSSSVKNITIDTLPKLVPQQTATDNGVDSNVFKQKCDTIVKELQKIYKFEVKSNTYETVKDYTGFAYEVEFDGDCYVAKYVVGGNFSYTYSVKSQTSNGTIKRIVTATATDLWFACSATYTNCAISMSIRPRTNLGNALASCWAFPYNSDTTVSTEWRCKVGTIEDINCAEEVKLYKEKCKGGDAFIDNRKLKESDSITDLYDAVMDKSSTIIDGIDKKYFGIFSDNDGKFLNVCSCIKVYYKDRGYISSGDLVVETPVSKDKMVSYILDYFGERYKGMFSCFSAPKMNSTQLEALRSYSGSDYESLNSGLFTNNLSFDDYILYYELHEFLKKCRINRHMHLFRGVRNMSVSTGDIISCNNFSSISFDLDVACNFSDSVIFRFTDVYGLNGFFINSISMYRNVELEVLLDAGYDIHVDDLAYKYKKYNVYNCHIVRNNSESNFSISNYKNKTEVFLYNLYMEIMSSKNIVSKGVVSYYPFGNLIGISFNAKEKGAIKGVKIKYKEDSNSLCISEDYVGSYNSKLVNTLEASESKFPDIIKYLEDICSKVLCPIGEDNMLVYTQVAQEFTDNGFIVIDDEVCSDYFKLVLSGDNDDSIVIRFRIKANENEYAVRVQGKSNGVSLDKTKSFADLDSLSKGVYTLIASSFNLNSANRSDKVMSIISRYLKVNETKVEESSNLFRYKLGDKEVIASLDGNGIVYSYNGNQVYTNHFDHITKVASNVYSTILNS